MATKLFLSWQDINKDCNKLRRQLKNQPIELIVAITKGGLIPAVILANSYPKTPHIITLQLEETRISKAGYKARKVRLISPLNLYPIKNKHLLIVDDVSDTGSTLKKAYQLVKRRRPKSITTAALHYKPRTCLKPDFFARKVPNSTWIVYPWE
jgi:hypoxanthine phosphoribosyltransferase